MLSKQTDNTRVTVYSWFYIQICADTFFTRSLLNMRLSCTSGNEGRFNKVRTEEKEFPSLLYTLNAIEERSAAFCAVWRRLQGELSHSPGGFCMRTLTVWPPTLFTQAHFRILTPQNVWRSLVFVFSMDFFIRLLRWSELDSTTKQAAVQFSSVLFIKRQITTKCQLKALK